MAKKAVLKHDYNLFSKSELASFLNKYESSFRYIESPFDIMISSKMDDAMEKIDKNIKNSKRLSEEYSRTNDGYKFLVESRKNHEEWQRLDKEYDKLSKLRFGY